MTRQHLIALAKRISQMDKQSRNDAAHAVADVCCEFNPSFDRDRLYRACGLYAPGQSQMLAAAMGLHT